MTDIVISVLLIVQQSYCRRVLMVSLSIPDTLGHLSVHLAYNSALKPGLSIRKGLSHYSFFIGIVMICPQFSANRI